jgi:hypothetical protein
MRRTAAICFVMLILPVCRISGQPPRQPAGPLAAWIDRSGRTVESRFLTPPGFVRVGAAVNSFAAYLRRLPLKPHPAKVRLFDGRFKENRGVYDAVVDLRIGARDLHQCADAVIRLRAEYLYRHRRPDTIHFNFTNGFRADYSKWAEGWRIVTRGNRTHWALSRDPSDSYADLWDYLEVVFSYAGTRSLAAELKAVGTEAMQIGDVFIQGGSPGHAVIVVDLAFDPRRGKKIFLLAQSYMPAQDIQILRNPGDPELSPWYDADVGDVLATPEWTFNKNDLKRFVEP